MLADALADFIHRRSKVVRKGRLNITVKAATPAGARDQYRDRDRYRSRDAQSLCSGHFVAPQKGLCGAPL
jgi:hypothetical protein